MQIAAIPINESDRLRSLRELKLLDTAAEPQFDAIVNAAALICGTPISLISLVDMNRQWFKANHGLEAATETPRELAFCAHAILSDALFEVTDATQDARFFDNPLVTGSPDIRFYAGVPLTLKDGSHIGDTLCYRSCHQRIDSQPTCNIDRISQDRCARDGDTATGH